QRAARGGDGTAQSRHHHHPRVHPIDRLAVARPVRAGLPVAVARTAVPARSTPAAKRPGASSRGAEDAVEQGSIPGAQQAEMQLALAAQAARFDAMMKVLAEQQREINAIIDFGMAQAKREDQLMNEWIRLI